MTDQFRTKVSEEGRVVIPSILRREFGLAGGDVVIARTDYGIEIMTVQQAIRRAQELVQRFVPSEVDLQADLREFRDRDASLD